MEALETVLQWLDGLGGLKDAMEAMLKWLNNACAWVVSFLPYSPFAGVLDAIETLPFLNYLNWFIPVSTFVAIGELWLVAIGTYYLYLFVMRWLKVVA